ncbi:MAG: N-acetylmuramoyl-L-alanine amidase [Saprospiraceae bacterium]|nr:N-acetylmuramoyl-L-alanine amidase [Saprospiraceae bacterium]
MVLDFVQKNTTILRIVLIITMILYYVSTTLNAAEVKVLLKDRYICSFVHPEHDDLKMLHVNINQIPDGQKKVKKIVIDAGHGGHDSGCVGKNSMEKDLTLKIAVMLGALIQQKYPDVEVLQTRTTDVFIPLFRRIQYANEQNADLFISIHCNFISNTKTRGSETFVMGLHRAEDNLEVAKRENASMLLEQNYEQNYEGYDPNSPEGHIMMSMFQNAYLDKSIEFAADIEAQFSALNISKSRGVKQAGFAVLRRASMPAVLVEAGFLSNELEEAYLISDEGQSAVSNALLRSFESFYTNNFDRQNQQIANTKKKADNEKSSHQEFVSASTLNDNIDKKVIENVPDKSKSSDKVNLKRQVKAHDVSEKPFYKIQIAAIKDETRDMDSSELRKIGILSVVKSNEVHKYMVGNFKTREEATIAKEKLKKIGYTGAFLVPVLE